MICLLGKTKRGCNLDSDFASYRAKESWINEKLFCFIPRQDELFATVYLQQSNYCSL